MGLETREAFLEEWEKVSKELLGPDESPDRILRAGNELYDARVLAYNVAEEGLNITAHRYFHGMASVSLNFMLQLPLEGMMSFLVGETLFHEGFIAGVNYGRNGEGDGTGLGDAQGAVECIGPRDNLIRTRGEIEAGLMPMPVVALQELQKMAREMAQKVPPIAVGPGEEDAGSPVIPPDEDRGYA